MCLSLRLILYGRRQNADVLHEELSFFSSIILYLLKKTNLPALLPQNTLIRPEDFSKM